MSHLLSPSELHAEAPGVLDVVFGADGEFLLAPMFRPPLWHADGYWVWQYQVDDLTVQPLSLDLRVPSVAARLAGLCARALGFNLFVGALCSAYQHGDYFTLAGPHGMQEVTWSSHGWPTSRAFVAPDLPREAMTDPPAFLRALTIALAPRIRDISRRES